MAQRVKHPPAMQETQVQALGWEDPLEKEMATYSSIFAWRIPRTEEPGRLQTTGSQRVRHDLGTSLSLSHLGGQGPPSYLDSNLISSSKPHACYIGGTQKVFAKLILEPSVHQQMNG